jgi:membrane protease YdiL (CAAX protease family)
VTDARALVRAHPLEAFWVATLVCSWWPWPLYLAGAVPSPVVGFGPALGACIVLALTEGGRGVRELWWGITRWRVAPGWYALALGLPVAVTASAAALNVAAGAQAPTAGQLARWPDVLSVFVLFLTVPGIGGTWEEPGFRGYALTELRITRSLRSAAALLGVGWVLWHLPLFVHGFILAPDVLAILGAGVVLAWLVDQTGSVLLAMLLHTMNNAFSGEFVAPMFTGVDAFRQATLTAAVWAALALALLAFAPAYRGARWW